MEEFGDFDRFVEDTYQKEWSNQDQGDRSLSRRSIRDVDLHADEATAGPPISRLDLLGAWRTLIKVLREKEVFLDHLTTLRQAFVTLDNFNPTEYRHLHTLVHLMAHTAVHHHRDDSTECRYVTLLEIMMSYNSPTWTSPSNEVTRFWMRLMQRIPADISPVAFRRKAYRVLVSLSWVPITKGLLAACSFEEKNKPSENYFAEQEGIAAGVRAHMKRIRQPPLPRHDGVNQLLDRLKDETDVCVAIASDKDGVGKTTMAALVASHPAILRVFKVLWLSMKGEKLTYDTYTAHLDDLCHQAELVPGWTSCEKRFEEQALQKLREGHFMVRAKDRMAKLLRSLDQNVLLVLDDVTDQEELTWFRFNERQSIIVTTSDPKLDGVDWNVLIDPMMDDEATELFLREANLPPSHAAGWTSEVQSIVRLCQHHPLTIRCAARWLQMMRVTAGLVSAMEELLQTLEKLAVAQEENRTNNEADEEDADEDETPSLLFDVLSLMMGPTRMDGQGMSPLFVLCFAAMVVVFSGRVPLDVVVILWEQIMRIEPLAIDELCQGSGRRKYALDPRRHAWLIAEVLTQMGVVHVTEDESGPWIEAHHGLFVDFAMLMARELDLEDTFEKICEEWHKAFVTSYFELRIQASNDSDQNSWAYAVEKLPSHIFQAKMLPMAEALLTDERFFHARVGTVGWDKAVESHLKDCVHLQQNLESELADSMENVLVLSSVFAKTSAIVSACIEEGTEADIQAKNEVSSALYKIGFALAENGYFEEAIIQFDAAQSFMPQSPEIRASVLYGTAWVLLASGESELALKKVETCLSVMGESSNEHQLYRETMQLKADALVEKCDYQESIKMFDVIESELVASVEDTKIELGTVYNRKGQLYHVMGDLATAREAYEMSIKCKEEIGECSHSLAIAYSKLADLDMENGQHFGAREGFDCALRTLENLNCDLGHVNRLMIAGKAQLMRNDFGKCFLSLEEARKAINIAPLLLMDQSAYDLRCIARAYQYRGDLNSAISVLDESIVLTNYRAYSLERTMALLDIGNCLIGLGKVKQGLGCLEQAHEIQMLKLGECNRVLDTLKVVGRARAALGSSQEALKTFTEVLKVTERIAPGDAERIAETLFCIGEIHEASGDTKAAMKYFDESVQRLKEHNMVESLDMAMALQRMGSIFVQEANYEKAQTCYEEALRIRRMHFGNVLVAETLHCLGVVFRKNGENSRAQEVFLEALGIREAQGLKKESVETMIELGFCYRQQSENTKALELYEKCLNCLEDKTELLGRVILSMGHTKLATGNDQGAMACYQQAREIQQDIHGEDDIQTGRVLRSLGIANFSMELRDEAFSLLTEFVRICDLSKLSINGKNTCNDCSHTADYAVALMMIGDIHCTRDKFGEAKRAWTVAKQTCEANGGFAKEVPDLNAMIDKRLGSEEDSTCGAVDPLEGDMLRQIVFIDD